MLTASDAFISAFSALHTAGVVVNDREVWHLHTRRPRGSTRPSRAATLCIAGFSAAVEEDEDMFTVKLQVEKAWVKRIASRAQGNLAAVPVAP